MTGRRIVGTVFSRRDFGKWSALAAAAATLPRWTPPALAQGVSSEWLTIESVERITLKVPFRIASHHITPGVTTWLIITRLITARVTIVCISIQGFLRHSCESRSQEDGEDRYLARR